MRIVELMNYQRRWRHQMSHHNKTSAELIMEHKLKKAVVKAFNDTISEHQKKLKNPLYRFRLWLKRKLNI